MLSVRSGVADAAEQAPAGLGVGVEHLGKLAAEPEVGMGHDSGNTRPGAISGLGGHSGHELGFTHWSEVFRTTGTVGGAALHKDRLLNPVSRPGVSPQVGEQVLGVGEAPQVVVGINDCQFGLDDLLINLRVPLRPLECEHLAPGHGTRT